MTFDTGAFDDDADESDFAEPADSAAAADQERDEHLRRCRYETAARVLEGYVRLTLEYVDANDATDPRAARRMTRGMLQELRVCLEGAERLVLALMTGCTEYEITIIQGHGGRA